MNYYFAPMEGLTDSIYRRAHHRFFGGVDRYYMPFFSPTVHRALTSREIRELPKADSVSFTAVPQVLTKCAEDFLWAAEVVRDLGYEEINLNIGCPSGTVVAKGKGSGMLRDLDGLAQFFDHIFAAAPLPVSVKTRIALENPGEFPAILELYNRYPIQELTIHPRVRKQFYDGQVHREWFTYAVEHSKNPLCFNGDIRTIADIDALQAQYPGLNAVMIGRGLIADPGMLVGGTDIHTLEAFLNALMDDYEVEFASCRNALFRMKENWAHLHDRFGGSDRLWKKMRKTTDAAEFRRLSAELLHTCPMVSPKFFS
ncbi:MAG: tRNA-dihydrouridine synthase family protein [Eubacteriales bacterium]|nr:tRNA-dihydrouridine synthase family protein [Eubacteriales bacterium]